MIFREATINDIPQMQVVWNAVKENGLSDHSLITSKDYEQHLTVSGQEWVCEVDNRLAGFAIANLKAKTLWAFFVHPDFERQGNRNKAA